MKPQNFLGNMIAKPSRTARAVLLLCLEIVLVVPTCSVSKIDRGVKSADSYWHETGLTARELESILEPTTCLRDHRQFLGCVNAISSIAERYNLVLNLDGKLVPMDETAIARRLTERKEMEQWEAKFTGEEISPDFSFLDVWKTLDKNHVKPEERAAVIASGINGYLSITKDPHTYILPLAFYEEVLARNDARPTHLGFISKRVRGGAYVRKVFEGSPAALAGLKKGDRITEINGTSILSLHPSQYSEMLRVRVGDRLRLSLERKEHGRTSTKYVEILKSDAIFPNVLARMVDENKRVGLITIHKFARETCSAVHEKLIGLKEEGLRGLILDLRDNPGGQVDEAACILNLFIGKNQKLFETRYLDVSKMSERYTTTKHALYKGPLSILINGGSASASEIVAGVVKDLNRGTLVGERSFGKGSFQDGRIWGLNSNVALFETEGLYYFPSGWTPQLVGLEPDLKVTSLEDETLREEELYYSSIRPSDLWSGPQSLAWINELGCAQPMMPLQEDPQIEMAYNYLNCDSTRSSRDRNDSF